MPYGAINIRNIDRDLMQRFHAKCVATGTNMTARLIELMQGEVDEFADLLDERERML